MRITLGLGARMARGLLIVGVTMGATACMDLSGPDSNLASSAALRAALNTVPAGYGSVSSSYVGDAAPVVGQDRMWLGGGREAGMERGAMMGGGMGDAFTGAMGMERGFGHQGPFGGGPRCNGTFDAASGRVVCATQTLPNGLTVTASAQFKDANGTIQQAFDTLTTSSVNLRHAVTGTITFDSSADQGPPAGGGRRGWGHGRGAGGRLLGDTSTILTATTTVNNSSDRTTTGLAQGSTERTVHGVSAGSEQTTGTSSKGSFTATKQVADTTRGLVIPVSTTRGTYPTAGTVIRFIRATLAYAGESAVSLERREVVTYDGSATAKVVLTENGTTKNCTRPLPRGPLTCE